MHCWHKKCKAAIFYFCVWVINILSIGKNRFRSTDLLSLLSQESCMYMYVMLEKKVVNYFLDNEIVLAMR